MNYPQSESMDHLYAAQFVQNETVSPKRDQIQPTREVLEYEPLEHTPIIAGTITGTIYLGATAIQTFVWMEDGELQLTKIGSPAQYVVCGHINLDTGAFMLQWSHKKAPRFNHVVVNYEYNLYIKNVQTSPAYLADAKYPAQSYLTDSPVIESKYVKPTFETFFSTEELVDIGMNAGTVTCWDFSTCIGDTIKEKYESLYCKVHELASIMQRKGAKGYFWIATSPEIASIFEVATAGFAPAPSSFYKDESIDGHFPMGLDDVRYAGVINARYRLYKFSNIEKHWIIVGVNDRREKPAHYGKMVVSNLIF